MRTVSVNLPEELCLKLEALCPRIFTTRSEAIRVAIYDLVNSDICAPTTQKIQVLQETPKPAEAPRDPPIAKEDIRTFKKGFVRDYCCSICGVHIEGAKPFRLHKQTHTVDAEESD